MPPDPALTADFTPPTPEQVRAHLDRYPPRPPSRAMASAPPALIAAALLLAVGTGIAWLALLPWVLLMALLGFMGWRAHTLRQVEFRVARAHEMAMTRRWSDALREGWHTLPPAAAAPELHARTVALIGQTLDQVRAYDAAVVAYQYLIDRLPPEHPGTVPLRVRCAIAQLAGDRLLDADTTLRKLRGRIDAFHRTAVGALYRFAGLIQQVRTRHFTDAVEGSANLVEELRPLGLEAGYGHALMALSYTKLAQRGPEAAPDRPPEALWEQARAWWSRATLLLPPAALTHRFTELDEVDTALSRPGAATPAPAALAPTEAPR